jgi:hypothetical protein
MARSTKVPNAPFSWKNLAGPWFDNSIAVLEERPDGLAVRWHTGTVHGGDHLHPRLDVIADELIEPNGSVS